jgi:hypothetical protein
MFQLQEYLRRERSHSTTLKGLVQGGSKITNKECKWLCICRGRHERFVINREKFDGKLAEKTQLA